MNSEQLSNENPFAYCAFCGKPLLQNAKFCSFCGQEQVATTICQMQADAVESAPEVDQPGSKPTRKGTVFLVLGTVFSVLALIIVVLMKLISFRTNRMEIIFFSGSSRETVSHDMTMYFLWFGGLILASAFIIAAIVCLIMRFVTKTAGLLDLILGCIFLVSIMIFYCEYMDDLHRRIEDYKVVSVLDAKNTTKDFIPYDPDKD